MDKQQLNWDTRVIQHRTGVRATEWLKEEGRKQRKNKRNRRQKRNKQNARVITGELV